VRNQTASGDGHTVRNRLSAAHDFSFESPLVNNVRAG
jgi:hypothetical protein